jgi:putative FmdB family regulatory protein
MLYDFKCEEHGVFEAKQSVADHTGYFECPTCGQQSKQVILKAPGLDVEGMADAGCPGAFMSSGDRMTKRHNKAGQDHHYWRDDVAERPLEGSAWDD